MRLRFNTNNECRIHLTRISLKDFNNCIAREIINTGIALSVIITRLSNRLLMERQYIQNRSGRLAGSLTHTLMPKARKKPANKSGNPLMKNQSECIINVNGLSDELKDAFNKRQCKVLIRNPPNIQEIFDSLSSNKINLRKRKLKNYIELSLIETPKKDTIDCNKNKKHVPVYKQLNDAEEEQRKTDLYEFDSDSENVKKKKRRKVDHLDNHSICYEKDMKETMQAIEKNFKKNQKRKLQRKAINRDNLIHVLKDIQSKLKKNGKGKEQDKMKLAINNNNNKGRNEVFQKELNLVQTVTKVAQNDVKLAQNQEQSVLKSTGNNTKHKNFDQSIQQEVELISQNYVNPSEENHEMQSPDIFDDHSSHSHGFNGATINPTLEKIEDENYETQSPDIFDNDINQSVSFRNFDDNRVNNGATVDRTLDKIEDQSKFFGFTTDSECDNRNSKRINVISNIVVKPLNSSIYRNFQRPNANSTMIIPSKKGSSSPWRPDLGITRNPYVLQFKETLLPNYNQEMVINSTISEKDTCKTPERTKQKPLQTSILEYVNSNKDHNSTSKILASERSLFDDADFSPIKSLRSHDKENLAEQKTSTAVKKIKRDVFSPKGGRIPLSPLQNLPNVVDDEADDYFGFNSFTEEDKENATVRWKKPETVTKSYFNKPVRFIVQKKSADEDKSVVSKDVVTEKENLEPLESQVSLEVNENGDAHLRLFEDLEIVNDVPVNKQPVRKYKAKRTRRVRLPSYVSEHSEDEDDHSKNKKKNVWSKEEEKNFNQWAAAFNSMCQEVEEFPLDID